MLERLKRSLVSFEAGGSTSIAGAIPDGLYACSRLQEFLLGGCKKINGEISGRVGNLRRLRHWNTWGTDMTSPDDGVARKIFGLGHLEHFQASNSEGDIVTYVQMNTGNPPHSRTRSPTRHPLEDGACLFVYFSHGLVEEVAGRLKGVRP